MKILISILTIRVFMILFMFPTNIRRLNYIKQWLSLLFCRSRNTMLLWLEAFILKTQTVQYKKNKNSLSYRMTESFSLMWLKRQSN